MRDVETLTEARAVIREIDRAIDANRAELRSRCTRKPKSWRTWGYAWERNPDLHQRDRNLFWLRGEFQRVRDRLEHRAEINAARRGPRPRKSKCPTCGVVSFAA